MNQRLDRKIISFSKNLVSWVFMGLVGIQEYCQDPNPAARIIAALVSHKLDPRRNNPAVILNMVICVNNVDWPSQEINILCGGVVVPDRLSWQLSGDNGTSVRRENISTNTLRCSSNLIIEKCPVPVREIDYRWISFLLRTPHRLLFSVKSIH